MSTTTSELRVAGTCSGVGGIELGFQQAGFTTAWANEMDPHANKTYAANFGSDHLDTRSVWEVNPREIPDHEVFVGGIPCQAFSHSGSRKGFADERGVLFNAFARILTVKKPQAFLLENVKGMLTHDGGRTFPIIKEALEDAGYTVSFRVMNSAEYGNIPQGRERIYVVGFRSGAGIAWPEPIARTVEPRDVLEATVPEKYFYDERYGKIYDLARDFMVDDAIYQYRHMTGMRRNQSGLFPTLAAYMGTGGHNVPLILDGGRIRKLTPRECFNAMGYPADFVLPTIADGHLYKQAGNSVAVPVVKRIAEEIKRVLLAEDMEIAA